MRKNALNNQIHKAGIIILGKNDKGERAFLMPYTEGRFGYDRKYPSLPIGSVDPGESVREAAARETEEETGISIQKLLGDGAYLAFLQEKPIRFPIHSEGYPGVVVTKIGSKPIEHTYISRANVPKHCRLFTLEVLNIDVLSSHLKGAKNQGTETDGTLRSIRHITEEHSSYPSFYDFLEWLDSGNMPARTWNEGKKVPPALYGEGENVLKELLPQKDKDCILSYGDWRKFCNSLTPEEFDRLSIPIAKIKNALCEMGIIGKDNSIIKLDDKDTPLNFFQEGAQIYPVETYLKECRECLSVSADYRLAFGATERSDQKLTGMKAVKYSQVAAVAGILPTEVRRDFFKSLKVNHGVMSSSKMGAFAPLEGLHVKKTSLSA